MGAELRIGEDEGNADASTSFSVGAELIPGTPEGEAELLGANVLDTVGANEGTEDTSSATSDGIDDGMLLPRAEGSKLALGGIEGLLLGLPVGKTVIVGLKDALGENDGDSEIVDGTVLGIPDSFSRAPEEGAILGTSEVATKLLGEIEGKALGFGTGAAVEVGDDDTLGSTDGTLDCVGSSVDGAVGDCDNNSPVGATLGLSDNSPTSITVGPVLGGTDGGSVPVTVDKDGR